MELQQEKKSAELEEELKNHILSEYLHDGEVAGISTSADLIEVLNSMQILRVVTHLESTYGIRVNDDEMTAENLGSVERLAAFVVRKRE